MDKSIYTELEKNYLINLDAFLITKPHKTEYDFLKENIKLFKKLVDDCDDEIAYTLNQGVSENDNIDLKIINDKIKPTLRKMQPDYQILELTKKRDYYNKVYKFYSMQYDVKFNNQQVKPNIKNPFKNPETNDVFNYIVNQWNYDVGQKWADIYTYLDDLIAYDMPDKKDYQKYIILKYQYTGKFQYDIISKKNLKALFELIENYNKK